MPPCCGNNSSPTFLCQSIYKNMKNLLIILVLVYLNIFAIVIIKKFKAQRPRTDAVVETIPIQPKPNPKPSTPKIANSTPGYQDYNAVVKQLETWKEESKDLVETGIYGKSTSGKDLHYIRVTNLLEKGPKPKVLITACIHGNEPLSASTVMAYIGNLLAAYGTVEDITELLDTRDIYFIPVVSPDSYPNSRHVDGVDPNRDFPSGNGSKQSVKPVSDLQKFFLQHKFNAVISAHTWGKVYLTPWGDQMKVCPNHEDYVRVIGKMCELSGYEMMRACELYKGGGGMNIAPIRYGETGWTWGSSSVPIHGSELDWYYRNGAFAIVMEMGTHQRIPTIRDVEAEFAQTFKALKHFLKEAPIVKIH